MHGGANTRWLIQVDYRFTRWKCSHGRAIKRQEVEQRVLAALQQRFLTKARLDEFTRVYVAETNRLGAEHQTKVADARREFEAIDRRQMQFLVT
jgi:hypothetical protein